MARRLGLMGDTEKTPVVLAPEIWLKRFRVTDQQRRAGALSRLKPMKAAVEVDVVCQYHAARAHRSPSSIEFKQQIPLGVLAVVDKQVDLPSVGKQSRQTVPARSPHVSPPVSNGIGHCHTDLGVRLRGAGRRQIDAPKMPFAIALEGLERNA